MSLSKDQLPRIPPKHLKDGCYARADALEAHLNAAKAENARLQKREAQFAAALYAVKEVVAKDSPQWLLADQLVRMMLSAPPAEPSVLKPADCLHASMQCKCCGDTFSRQDGVQ